MFNISVSEDGHTGIEDVACVLLCCSRPHSLKIESLTEPGGRLVTSKSQPPFHVHLTVQGLQAGMVPHTAFWFCFCFLSVGSGDLNPGPCACTVNTF